MEMQDIFSLLDRFSASSVTSLELEMGEVRLKLGKEAVPVAAAAAPVQTVQESRPQVEDDSDDTTVNAPLVGTFYAAPAPGEAAFVTVGDHVKKGQTVCLMEAMKMMSEVPAPMDCEILEVLVKDGELVGYDTPLFRVREL